MMANPWLRHLPGARIIELDTELIHPCQCSLWRRRWMLLTQGIKDAWRER